MRRVHPLEELLPRRRWSSSRSLGGEVAAGRRDRWARRAHHGESEFGVISRIFSFGIEGPRQGDHARACSGPPRSVLYAERIYSDEELKRLWAAWVASRISVWSTLRALIGHGATPRRGGHDGVAAGRPGAWPLDATDNEGRPRSLRRRSRRSPSKYCQDLPVTVPVWCSTTQVSIVSGFSKAVRRARKLSGVRDSRPHDLRRTAGTGMARLGIPKITISRVLNHAEGGVTDIRWRWDSYLEEKRSALNQWARKLRRFSMRLPSARKSFMKPDTTDPFADVLAFNPLPYLPPDSLLPGLPLSHQMSFIVVPLIPNEWFEDVAALLGVPSPLKAQIVLENTREGTIRIGPPEDPTFQRYYALCSAIHSIHSTAFLELSRSLHQNTEATASHNRSFSRNPGGYQKATGSAGWPR